MTDTFISNLSYRFRSENDLSDITWTMCQTSPAFQDAFLKFFFPKVRFSNVLIEREKSNDDSRPDFYIDNAGICYLIECKIYDRNHHFEQYVKKFKIPHENLGYITNYPYQKKGFIVKTWTELYVYLKDMVPKDEASLWEGYLRYLQDVCSITLFSKPMKIEGMSSLYTFYQSLDEVFAVSNDCYSSSYYDSRKDTNGGGNFYCTPREGVMGKFFEIDFKGRQFRKSWGWMGVYFCNEEPTICIGFSDREGWGRPIYNKLKPIYSKIKKGRTYDAPYSDDGDTSTDAIWFDFNQSHKFDNLDLESQKALLKSFFTDVMDIIYKTVIG